ncbi:hypothetical protein ACLOJK_031627 [Asimina triloba]
MSPPDRSPQSDLLPIQPPENSKSASPSSSSAPTNRASSRHCLQPNHVTSAAVCLFFESGENPSPFAPLFVFIMSDEIASAYDPIMAIQSNHSHQMCFLSTDHLQWSAISFISPERSQPFINVAA